MIAGMVYGTGSRYDIGYAQGEGARAGVRHNLGAFWEYVEQAGYDRDTLLEISREQSDLLAPPSREQIAGMADGARTKFADLLAFNLYHSIALPDECTVTMAVGRASASGDTILAKNSDKVGGETLVGPSFFKYKEVNVIVLEEMGNGLKILGVTAAGIVALKMGMNNRGVAAACSIARTEEMYQKKLDLTQIRAIDRGYLVRLGLEQAGPAMAVQVVAGKLMEAPMATPGNLEFADAHQAFIIEGSYDRLAIKKVVDDVDSRSNCFIVLKDLNKKDDVSSQCRYWRTQEVLQAKKGKLSMEDLVQISMDHTNGPGPNSVCRHGTDFHEEVSLSAMVMGLNSQDPEKARFGICLGKPCHAWRDTDGHVFGDMSWSSKDFPQGLVDGTVFKRFYQEEPRF